MSVRSILDDSYFDLLTQLGPSGAQCSLFPLKRILLNCDVVYKFVIFHQTGFFQNVNAPVFVPNVNAAVFVPTFSAPPPQPQPPSPEPAQERESDGAAHFALTDLILAPK